MDTTPRHGNCIRSLAITFHHTIGLQRRSQAQRWLQQSLEQHGRYITSLIQKQSGALPPKPDLPPPPPALQAPPASGRTPSAAAFPAPSAGARSQLSLSEAALQAGVLPAAAAGRSSPAPGLRRSRSRLAAQSYSSGDGGAALQQQQQDAGPASWQPPLLQQPRPQLVASSGPESTADGGQMSSLAFPPLDSMDGSALAGCQMLGGTWGCDSAGAEQHHHEQQQGRPSHPHHHHEEHQQIDGQGLLAFEPQPAGRPASAPGGYGGGGQAPRPFDPLRSVHDPGHGGLGNGQFSRDAHLMGNSQDSRWVGPRTLSHDLSA